MFWCLWAQLEQWKCISPGIPQEEDWVCCWRAQEVFTKSPGSSRCPSGPVLPALLLLCSMQYSNCDTTECTWGKGPQNTQCHRAKMFGCLRIPGGWLHTLVLPCMRKTVLLQNPSLGQNQEKNNNFNNQLALKHVQDPPPSLWLRDGGAAVPEGAGCGKAPASISAHIPHLCGISGQGWTEAAFTSAWEKPPEEKKGNSYNWRCGFEISTKSRVAK